MGTFITITLRFVAESTDRCNEYKVLRRHFHKMIMDLIRHCTSSMDLVHAIIHFGIVIFITSESFLPVKKLDATAVRREPLNHQISEVSSIIGSFVARQRAKLYKELEQLYEILMNKGIGSINGNLTRRLIDGVVLDARTEKLKVSLTHCVDNRNGIHVLNTHICYGLFATLKSEEDNDGFFVIDPLPRPRFLHHISSSVEFSSLRRSNASDIVIKNPLLCKSIGWYLENQWGGNLPLISNDVCRMCFVSKGAVVENSNQGNEGAFKDMKTNLTRTLACRDMALYINYFMKESREGAALLHLKPQKCTPHSMGFRL